MLAFIVTLYQIVPWFRVTYQTTRYRIGIGILTDDPALSLGAWVGEARGHPSNLKWVGLEVRKWC